MRIRDHFLKRLREFLAESDVSARQFGLDAVGDGKFVSRLEAGAGVTLTTLERAEAYMDAQPPRSKAEVA